MIDLDQKLPACILRGLAAYSGGKMKSAAISFHRQLLPEEQAAIAEAQDNWLPRLVVSGGTPLIDTMSSPRKGMLLEGGLGGILGGAGGAGLAHLLGQPVGLGAGIGAGLGAGVGAAHGFNSRRHWNEDVTDLLRRFPPGATYRDYLADTGDSDYENDRQQNLRAMRYIAKDLSEDVNREDRG